MTKIYTHIFTFGLGAILVALFCRSCNPTPPPQTTTVIKRDTVTEYIYVPVVSGEGKSVLKYTYSGMVHDTIIRNDSVFITLRDSVSFTAKLDTIQDADTLNLEFSYPSAIFSYRLSRSPIEVKYVNTVATNTVTIPPNKFQFGVQTGIGYLQSFRTGQNAIGWYVGFGVGYKL
jgi:hypothetical protein